jgi:peptidoglycan hydrolase CwlO-like protein
VIINTTTLGSDSLVPTSVLGKITSCVVAYSGILCIALPISIVGKNFTEQYNHMYHLKGGLNEDPNEVYNANGNGKGTLSKQPSVKRMPSTRTLKKMSSSRLDELDGSAHDVPKTPEEQAQLIAKIQSDMARLEKKMDNLRARLQVAAGAALQE